MEKIKEKILIINADDAGLSDDINKAVRRCFQDGALTATSIIACGDAYKQASEMLHVLDKTDVGVHLTLTGAFIPCAAPGDIPSLVENGKFFKDYQALLAKYICGKINIDEVSREFISQIEKVKQEGLSISHIDSHEHIHLFPKILDVVIKLAGENNIKYIRIPDEPKNIMFKSFKIKDVIRYSGLKTFVRGAKKKVRDNGLVCNDYFWGHFHSGRLTGDILNYILDNLEDGINELCVHPAFSSEKFLRKYPWYRNANREMDVLISEDFRNSLLRKKVKLVSQRDLNQDSIE